MARRGGSCQGKCVHVWRHIIAMETKWSFLNDSARVLKHEEHEGCVEYGWRFFFLWHTVPSFIFAVLSFFKGVLASFGENFRLKDNRASTFARCMLSAWLLIEQGPRKLFRFESPRSSSLSSNHSHCSEQRWDQSANHHLCCRVGSNGRNDDECKPG